MDDLAPVLKTDVFDLKKIKIASAGQVLTPEFIRSLDDIRPPLRSAKTLTAYPEVTKDIYEFFTVPPYDRIFRTQHLCLKTMQLIERARIFPIVYESLMQYKQNNLTTYQHILMISALASRMANDLKSVYRHSVEAASVTPCHDFGKINIPLQILNKKEPLSAMEIDILRDHASVGYVLLTYYLGEEDPLACQVAYEHHELMDGSGYPRKIKESSELVQIVTICDIFDALVTPRPYRKLNYSLRGALEHLTDCADSGKVNIDCVKLLVSYNRADSPPLDKVVLSKEHREKEPVDNNYSLGFQTKEVQTDTKPESESNAHPEQETQPPPPQ